MYNRENKIMFDLSEFYKELDSIMNRVEFRIKYELYYKVYPYMSIKRIKESSSFYDW